MELFMVFLSIQFVIFLLAHSAITFQVNVYYSLIPVIVSVWFKRAQNGITFAGYQCSEIHANNFLKLETWNQQTTTLSHLTNTASPWFQPGWMSCHCTLQPWTQPFQAGWPCPSDGSLQPLASPWGEPLSWPCEDASGGTAACGAGHGSASSSGGRSTAASAAH